MRGRSGFIADEKVIALIGIRAGRWREGDVRSMRSKTQWKAMLGAASSGSREAQFIVACAYCDGMLSEQGEIIVPRNRAQAAKWMERAALAGEPSAMVNIGFYYDCGIGVRRDPDRALFWYEAVWKKHRIESAANNIAAIYRDKKDHRRAFGWYQKAADAGDGDALVEVAVRYLSGSGVRKDPQRGVQLLRRAIRSAKITESGRDDAKYQLGLSYLRGSGVPLSVARARKWLTDANRTGDHPDAVKALAEIDRMGDTSTVRRGAVRYGKSSPRAGVVQAIAVRLTQLPPVRLTEVPPARLSHAPPARLTRAPSARSTHAPPANR